MSNLGNARELVGRLSGDTHDGPRGQTRQQQHAFGVPVEEEHYDLSDATDGMRNKRSVSVDSGLQQRAAKKNVMSLDGMHSPIFEEEEDHMTDSPVSARRRRANAVVVEGGGEDGGGGQQAAGKDKKTTATKSSSRLRGRTAIHI